MVIVILDTQSGERIELNGAPAMIVKAVSEFSSRLPVGPFRMEIHVGERDVKLIPQPTYVFKEPS